MSRGETWRETAAFWSCRGLESAALALPEGIGRRLFVAGGDLAWRCMRGVRATVAANQARVLGLDPTDERVCRATREAFRLYARYWHDAFQARTIAPAALDARTELRGLHHIDAALARGKGCIAALPHTGNWDVAGCVFAARGYRLVAVAEALRPARLAELFRRHRHALGMRVILTGGASPRHELRRLLAENWIVTLIADRHVAGRAVDVAMFGAPRPLPSGPAMLSLATGAPLLACAAYTTPAGWRVEMGPPLEITPTGDLDTDVHALARLLGTAFERAIAASPSDWHCFQPGWRDAAAAADA